MFTIPNLIYIYIYIYVCVCVCVCVCVRNILNKIIFPDVFQKKSTDIHSFF